MIIQAIGHNPYKKPYPVAAIAIVNGILYANNATKIVNTTVINPATYPFMRKTAKAKKKKIIGISATAAEIQMLPNGS